MATDKMEGRAKKMGTDKMERRIKKKAQIKN